MASIASGQNRFIWDNIYLSQCPCEIILGLVSTEAQTGNYQKKPFNFQMFDTRQIGMFVNNVRVPGQPYKIDGDCYISAYSSLFDVVNKKILQCIHREKKTAFSSSSGEHWLVPSKQCLYLIVLEEGRLYPPAMIRTFFKRNSIQCTYNSSQI